MLKIALDNDGVMANLHSVVLPEASIRIGKVISEDQITSFLHFQEKYGWTEEENWAIYRDAWKNYKWHQIMPYERDVGILTACLTGYGHVDVVTAHEDEDRQNIATWLAANGVHYQNLILSGRNRKTEAYNYDVYIDDYYKTLKRASDAGKIAICFNQPWNRDQDVGKAHRINSLGEVPLILGAIK